MIIVNLISTGPKMRDMTTDTERTLTTTQTSLEIIDILDRMDGATVSQVASELEKPPSTVHGHLSTLKKEEFAVQKGDVYHLSLRFLTLGKKVRDRERLYAQSDRYTQRVVDETEFRSIFAVEEHGRGVYLSRNAGNHSKWRHEQTGERFYLHATAAGKVLLAHLTDDRIDDVVDRWGLPQLTENTITDRGELFEEIEEVRETGIAYNREEQIEGIRALSAPVVAPGEREIGALSANGAAHMLETTEREEELADTLRGIANEFRIDLKLVDDESQPRQA